jgi:hypothetical protein
LEAAAQIVHVVASKGYELKISYVALKVAEDLYCLARNRTPFLQFAPKKFGLKILEILKIVSPSIQHPTQHIRFSVNSSKDGFLSLHIGMLFTTISRDDFIEATTPSPSYEC